MAQWPGGARGALSLTFDNLGEAAEMELGALAADAPLGRHETALRCCRAARSNSTGGELAATFFVEGLNAELYPKLLREIDAAAATRSPTTPGATSSGPS